MFVLHNAIRSCNFEEIKAALESDTSEVNIPDPILGWTPLYKAVLYRDIEITRLLLASGADPDQCNQIGENALHMAVDNNLEEIIQLLIEYKAKLEFIGNDGQTPLHLAVLKRNERIVEILLQCGANVNIVNEVGKTPLHFAIENELVSIIKILMQAGADPNILDKCSLTPLQMTNNDSIIELIQSYTIEEKNKEASKNLAIESNENNENTQNSDLKENLHQKITKIDERILGLERSKGEIKELSLNIDQSLQQFKTIENNEASVIMKKTSMLSEENKEIRPSFKKKSLNFEEYKEKLSKETTDSPSVIKDESSIQECQRNSEPLSREPEPKKVTSESKISSQSPKTDDGPIKPESNIPITLKTVPDVPLNDMNIAEWLEDIKLANLLQNFRDLGIESSSQLRSLLQGNSQNWDKMLITHLGIDKPGYRKRVITKVKEDLGVCKRSGIFKLKNSNAKLRFLDMNEWLKSLGMQQWCGHFAAAGYDDYESLIFQMTTDSTINEKILEEDVMIDDPFARMKICNQLMEDALKACEIDAPENFDGEISFEINEQRPGTWKETCAIF